MEGETNELKEAEKGARGFPRGAGAAPTGAKACAYRPPTRSRPIRQLAAQNPPMKRMGCAELLEILSGRTSSAARVDTMTNGLPASAFKETTASPSTTAPKKSKLLRAHIQEKAAAGRSGAVGPEPKSKGSGP